MNEEFNFGQRCDLISIDPSDPIDYVGATAIEHGFRGVATHISNIKRLSETLGDSEVVKIGIIDYPFGGSCQAARAYAIHTAKENGCDEVEIVAPYMQIAYGFLKEIDSDLDIITTTGQKLGVKVTYVIDQNSEYLDKGIFTRVCRTISKYKPDKICLSLGFFDKGIDHSDNIVKARSIKSKVGINTKICINSIDAGTLSLYPKAGLDILGLDWKAAPNLVHAYNAMLTKKA
jgi:deoxyribose-phosphate aldolase